jgi:hypothetical protein
MYLKLRVYENRILCVNEMEPLLFLAPICTCLKQAQPYQGYLYPSVTFSVSKMAVEVQISVLRNADGHKTNP